MEDIRILNPRSGFTHCHWKFQRQQLTTRINCIKGILENLREFLDNRSTLRGRMILLIFLIGVTMGQLSKPEKNMLFTEYGINFRYIDEVKNGLDRVSVVTSIPIPRFKDLRINPIQFHNCSADLDLKNDNHHQLHIAISEWCACTTPYLQHIKRKEKYFVERLYGLSENDLCAVLHQL